jgi:catecholate siderophore receptor
VIFLTRIIRDLKDRLMHSLRLLALSSLTLCAATPAWAEDAAAEGEDQTIIVTGSYEGYRMVDTTSGTKTNTPILDVPQSISVVTDEQIGDQAIRSVTDLVRLIPGVSAGQGEGHRDQITLRGNNTTADFFVDGLRDDVQYFRSFYNVERVEVHKGPNAMVFGRGGGGGLINRVTKGALVDKSLTAGSISVDSFGSWYGAADVNVSLGKAAVRVNAFYEDLNNHRDAYGGQRYGFNPTLGAELGENIRLQLGYEYANDERVVDRGIPAAFVGSIAAPAGPVKGFRDAYFGVRGVNETKFEAHILRFRGEADLGDGVTFSAQALYGDYDKSYSNVFPATGVSSAGTIGIEAYREPTKRQNFIGQANLEWRGSTGGIDHVVLVGGEVTDQDSANERINGFFSATALTAANRRATVAFADPVAIPPIFFVAGPTGNSNRKVTSALSQTSFYIQDQASFGDHVDLIAGIRYDKLKIGVANVFTNLISKRSDDLWSPRVGLVFKPVEAASFYVSYSRSFLPQSGDQFLTFDASFAALEPETFDNYEIGAKWNIKPGLTITGAYYQLDRGNTRAAGPTAGTTVLTGGQRSKGFEVSLVGKVTPNWQTALGYSNTLASISKTTIAAPAGRRIGQVPKHQISLWNRYDVSDRLGLGLGLYHQSSQFATISNATKLPSYTRLDAAIYVKLTEGVEAQLNVENLTNTRYFPVAHNDNNISTGAPINGRFTINVKF